MCSSDKAGNQQLIRPAKGPQGRRWGGISAGHGIGQPYSSLIFLLVVGTLAISPRFARAQENRVGEYELKAAILYNLTRFVEWPAAAYPDPQTPTTLCILGRDPFGSSLTTLISKNATNGKPVLLRHLRYEETIRNCHLLYVSSSERKIITQIFTTLKGSNVLTVGEMDQFAARGGVIQFALQDKQVRFEINLEAASRGGLKISSRLLVLARIVNEQNHSSGNQEGPIPLQSLSMILSPASRSGALTFCTAGEEPPGRDPTGSIENQRRLLSLEKTVMGSTGAN